MLFVCWCLETIPLSDNSWGLLASFFFHSGENNSISLVAYPPLAARNPVNGSSIFLAPLSLEPSMAHNRFMRSVNIHCNM